MGIISKVVEKYNRKVQEARNKEISIYRSKEQMMIDKCEKGTRKSWFKKLGYAAVLNLPVTPHGILKSRVIKSLKEAGLGEELKLLVREVPGRQVKDLVSTVLDHNMRERGVAGLTASHVTVENLALEEPAGEVAPPT